MPSPADSIWSDDDKQAPLIARNVAVEYLAIAVNLSLGVAMLPFNIRHLGQSAYGLWVLVTSLTTYFSMLDLGYASAQVKFAAQYRARRDATAINEIASTLFFLFLGLAAVAYAAAIVLAVNLGHIFRLRPDQIAIGRQVLLIVSLNVALGLPFSVYGGIVNGFQRYYFNNVVSIGTTVAVAVVNVVVLKLGYGIVELVACTTTVRVLSLIVYRQTAHIAFPLLSIRWRCFRRSRLREVTGFSVSLLAIDIAGKINFSADTMVIGAFMSTAPIAVWSVAARLVDVTRMLTGVLSRFLFPTIVDSGTQQRLDRLRTVLLEGTRLSLAMVVPMAAVTAILAKPAIEAWVGPKFAEAVPVTWILATVVASRIGTVTGTSVLKGCGLHRMAATNSVAVAISNLILSVIFVRWFGLIGVAIGTLIPVVIVGWFINFPEACRYAQLPITRAVRTAIWPTVWPMIPVGILLLFVRDALPARLPMLAAEAVAAGLLYAAILIAFALQQADRDWYLRKLLSLLPRRSENAGLAA
jgi:O-antigen/teichoic acid export membrane protein